MQTEYNATEAGLRKWLTDHGLLNQAIEPLLHACEYFSHVNQVLCIINSNVAMTVQHVEYILRHNAERSLPLVEVLNTFSCVVLLNQEMMTELLQEEHDLFFF